MGKKGDYYLEKTLAYFKAKGYEVARVEFRSARQTHDTFGADLVVMNSTHQLWIQVTTKPNVSRGRKNLDKHTWPHSQEIVACVLFWEPRAKKPSIQYRVNGVWEKTKEGEG